MSKVQAALAALVLELGIVLLVQAWPMSPVLVRDVRASQVAAAAPAASAPLASLPAGPQSKPSPTPSPTFLPPIPPGYRVQIPRLAIDLEIVEGDIERDSIQQKTPVNYALHLPGTAIPGAGANSYIYAHARTGMFLSLWNVKLGDVVWISTPDHALRYVVSEIHPRVPPTDLSWTAPTAPDRLTLQTSTGPNPGDPRFVVIALPG